MANDSQEKVRRKWRNTGLIDKGTRPFNPFYLLDEVASSLSQVVLMKQYQCWLSK
jgi:hypothetical protein